MKNNLMIGASMLALVSLSACGGGGGGVNSPGSSAPPVSGGTGSGGGGTTTPTPTPAPTPTPTPVAPTPTPTPAPTPTPTPAPTPTPTPTPAPTPTPTPAPTPTPTPTPAPTPTPTPVYSAPVPPPPGYVVTPQGQQPVRSANDTAEYRANYEAAEYVNALYALDSGWNGHGVTIGVIDDGVNTSATTEFAGQINTALSKDFGITTDANQQDTHRNGIGDANSTHGTSVGAIIDAAHDGSGVEGLAPGAQIAVLRVDDETLDSTGKVVTKSYDYADAAIAYAATEKLKAVSMSLTPNGVDQTMAAQATNYAKTGGLIVNSAGNASGSDPIAAPEVTADNRQAWLFVGALDPTGTGYTLASYSNKAGSMADRYVVAPGSNVTIDVNGKMTVFSGTSSAAPVVSALVADILSKWPQLSGQDAGNIILSTAKNIGDSATFGKGLVDFQAALSPVNPTISNGSSSASAQSVDASAMVLPSIVNPQSIQKALSNVTVLDQFGRNYAGSLSSAVVQASSQDGHWMRRRLQQMSQGNQSDVAVGDFTGSFGYVSYAYGPQAGMVKTTMTNASMAFKYGDWNFTAGLNQANNVQSDIMGLAPFSDAVLAYSPMVNTSIGASYSIGKDRRIGMTFSSGSQSGYGSVRDASTQAASLSFEQGSTMLRATIIQERGSVFGYASAGGLALGSGETSAVFEGRHTFALAGGWSLQGYGSVGVTKLSIDGNSVVTGASALITTRLGFQADGPLFGGTLSLGAAQPLYVESGRAHLTVSTGYDLASESLLYSHEDASLATGRREVQFTAGYAHAVPGGSFRLGMTQAVNMNDRRALVSYAMHF